MDVKLGGTAAIVLLARLYALTAGSTEHSTVPRLRAAAAGGTLSPASADGLIEAYRFLTELRLRHQVEQIGQGLRADNRISLDGLTIDEPTTPAHHAAVRARRAGRHRDALLHELGDMRPGDMRRRRDE